MTILQMSLSASILIMVVIVIRALALHKLPKKTFLALWGIVLCRLLIPFSIQSQFSIYTLVEKIGSGIMEQNGTTTPNTRMFPTFIDNAGITQNTGATLQTTSPAVNLSPIMLIWIVGCIACALFFIVTHLHCRREYKTALPIQNSFVNKWKQEHFIKRTVQIRQSDKIAAPLTYGIWKPIVLLPKTTDYTDERRLQYILAHEYAHIKRFDTLLKWVLAAVLCIHWFNPLVWVMYILSNRDIELSCDETVVRIFGETIKSAYALALIGLEEKKSRFNPLCNNFSKNSIEERIKAIMKIKKTSLVGIILALLLVVGTSTAFVTSAQTTAPQTAGPESLAGQEIADIFADFGLTYDNTSDSLFFDAKPVREIWDATTRTLYALSMGADFPDNAIYLITIYENDTLVGLAEVSGEEFKRTLATLPETSGEESEVKIEECKEAVAEEDGTSGKKSDMKIEERKEAAAEEDEEIYSLGTGMSGFLSNDGNGTTTYDSTKGITESELALMVEYEKFGLTVIGDAYGTEYFYKGDLVCFFIDNHSGDDANFSGIVYDTENNGGSYYLMAKRDENNKLIAIEEINAQYADEISSWR